MVLTTTGKILLGVSITVAFVALLLPSDWLNRPQSSGASKCPLGYESSSGVELPPNHPPIGKPAEQTTTLYVNADIWTGSEELPKATALLVRGDGIIQKVYAKGEDAQAELQGVGKVVDMQGHYIIPGLIDPHIHLIPGGQSLSRVNLATATSREEFVATVAAAASKLPSGQWLLGGLWDDQLLGGLPQASWLDEGVGDRPALLTRSDLHMLVLSTAAMRAMDIDASTPDPVQGVIDRDEAGNPTGILRERAMQLVTPRLPSAPTTERRAALAAAQAHLLASGVTSVGDMGCGPVEGDVEAVWSDLQDVLLPAANDGSLAIRVSAYMPLSTWSRLRDMVAAVGTSHPSERLFWGGVKGFADGSLGSRTALMHEPYHDDESTAGVRVTELSELREQAEGASAAGLQVAVHAIGDRAVDDVLGMLREVVTRQAQCQKCRGGRKRHRIEHVQHVSGERSVAALAAGPVQLVMNPLHLLSDRSMLVPRLGDERSGRSFAIGSLLAAGAQLSFASDWPVVDSKPLLACFAAAFRTNPGSDEAPHSPNERISMEAALRAHTSAAARALLLEDRIGVLRPGYRADFVVLSGSPFIASSQEELPVVRQTYIDGRCVYGCGAPAA